MEAKLDTESFTANHEPADETAENLLQSEEDPQNYQLSSIEAIACASVLEEAADQIAIIGHMGDFPTAEADMTYQDFSERFAEAEEGCRIFHPETIEPYNVAMEKQKFIKFQKDRSFVEKILRETIHHLITRRNYSGLVDRLAQYRRQYNEENELLEKEMENKNKLNNLKALLESERREFLAEIQVCSENIGVLKDQLEDLIFENKIKSGYIESWENARTEQNNFTLDKQEEGYINIINKAKSDIEKEIRINAEIESFIVQTQREYEDSIQFWMERYDKEIEVRDTEIQVLKEKREEQFNRLQEISELYEQHKREIEEYLEVKEKRRLEAEWLDKRIKAAIKIQAWWRGVMVRKGFGRFRKKKGGKKDKGTAKKKGKK